MFSTPYVTLFSSWTVNGFIAFLSVFVLALIGFLVIKFKIEFLALIFVPIICVAFIILSGAVDRVTTDKISEANFINQTKFIEKVKQVGKIDDIDASSAQNLKMISVLDLKESFVKLSGTKDGRIVDVSVKFKKNDQMVVEVFDNHKDRNREVFEYNPKS